MAHPSDSAVQQAAEILIRDQAAAQLGMKLSSAMVRLDTGATVQVDGVAANETVLLEAFAHLGPLKGGQKHKVAADALKLITLGRSRPAATLILAFVDEQGAKYASGTGWLAQALAAWKVRVMVVELDQEQRDLIRAAHSTQTMRNAITETAAPAAETAVQTIEIDTHGYVPFEPRTPEQHVLGAELRNKLRKLRAGPGEILHATFSGRLPAGTDVENVLLYNLDGADVFAGSMLNGVSFELDPTPQPAGVRYTYTLAPETRGFRCWRATRSLATLNVELDDRPTLAALWWALRSSPAAIRPAGTRDPDEPYAIVLDIGGPAKQLAPTLLKGILDGIVCSLQSQTDPVDSTLAARIAEQVDTSADAIQEALSDTRPSALGVRRRLVCTRSTSVQWLPDDHLCTAAKLLFKPSDQWRITGTVAAVAPSIPQQGAAE